MPTLDSTFAALSDATRRAILVRLRQGEVALSDLAAPFEMTQTAVSKHVRILGDAGLVAVTKRGRTRYCRLSAAPMKSAADWLHDYRDFWEGSLSSLARFVEDQP